MSNSQNFLTHPGNTFGNLFFFKPKAFSPGVLKSVELTHANLSEIRFKHMIHSTSQKGQQKVKMKKQIPKEVIHFSCLNLFDLFEDDYD